MAKPWLSDINSRIKDSGVGREDFDLAHHAFEIEREFGVEFAGELLHAAIVGEAGHMQMPEAAIARD